MVHLLRGTRGGTERLLRVCRLALRLSAGCLAALPVASALLTLLTWLRWRTVPLRVVVADVVASTGVVVISLLPAAAVGACRPRHPGRTVVLGLIVAVLTIVPALSLTTGRSPAEVLAAGRARPVDMSMILASHAAGSAVAAAVAGAVGARRSAR